MESKSLAGELYREYEFASGRKYRIDKPQQLFVGTTTHKVLDSTGIVHCIAFPGPNGDTILRWAPINPDQPVQF